MESKNGGFVADDQEMHNSSQVHGMISEIDQSQKTGVYKPNIWKQWRNQNKNLGGAQVFKLKNL